MADERKNDLRQITRDSGIPCLGQVPWGTHICHFYNDRSELLKILIPYFVTGLKKQECCIWICSEPLGVSQALDILGESVPGLESYVNSGQFQAHDYRQWYLSPDGRFAPELVCKRWKQKLEEALSAGFAGLRVTGNTSWLDTELWQEFSKYESNVCGCIAQDPILALCSYPRRNAWVPDPVEVAQSHQYVIISQDNDCKVIECSKHWDTLWESLFDGLADGLLIVDEKGRILMANLRLFDLFEVSSLEQLGGDLDGFSKQFNITADSVSDNLYLPNVIHHQGAGQYWKTRFEENSKERYFVIRVHETKDVSVFSRRFVIAFEDMTKFRQNEHSKDRFVQVMSHELKNPIQVMKAAVKILNETELTDGNTMQRLTNLLDSQISHLTSLVDELSMAFKINSRKIAINPSGINIVDVLNDCVDAYVTQSGHVITKKYPKFLDTPILADKLRLREILSNILSNSVKYTPFGKRIWIDVHVSQGYVIVKVEDEGIGIPQSEMDKIFEPFYRAANAVAQEREGVGLGLYISRELARMQKGDLWIEPRPGGGTEVYLRLPGITGVESQ